MATQGSTYRQEMPDGPARHRKHVAEMAAGAKARRAKKGRGNGKRYLYDGKKEISPTHKAAIKAVEVLAHEG
jgi:hypothetical protein